MHCIVPRGGRQRQASRLEAILTGLDDLLPAEADVNVRELGAA